MIKSLAGQRRSIALKKVWTERKAGIRPWPGTSDDWKDNKKAFSLACDIQENYELDIGIVPDLQKFFHYYLK